ncbi:MAG TPA: nickel insertion protein [Spirochaetia bacterium]|nr:nickel insertion protein [Spirochaetia bacterium]
MNIIYFDCCGGLSVQAALAALQEAAGSPPATAGPAEAVLAALGSLPCPPEEKTALHALDGLLQALPEHALYFSPLPLEHLPTAALRLLTSVAVQPGGGPVTTAGAALVRVLGRGETPPFVLRASGTGRGQGALVRAFLGERPVGAKDEVMVLEANLDDFHPEFYPHLTEVLLAAGALDVFLTPVIMKKGRPGTKVTVLTPLDGWQEHAERILAQTSTLGVRLRRESRLTLPRRMIRLDTPYGPVRAKVSELPDGRRKVKPEYEDCRQIALAGGLVLTEVYRAALQEAWRVMEKGPGEEGISGAGGGALADE